MTPRTPEPFIKEVFIDKYVEVEYTRPQTPEQEEIIQYVDRIIEVEPKNRPHTPPAPPPKEVIVYHDRIVEIPQKSKPMKKPKVIEIYKDRVIEVPVQKAPIPPPPRLENILYRDKHLEVDPQEFQDKHCCVCCGSPLRTRNHRFTGNVIEEKSTIPEKTVYPPWDRNRWFLNLNNDGFRINKVNFNNIYGNFERSMNPMIESQDPEILYQQFKDY